MRDLFASVLEVADLAGVEIRRTYTRPKSRAPRGAIGIARAPAPCVVWGWDDIQSDTLLAATEEDPFVLLHEIGHVVWFHPEKGVDVIETNGQMQWEYAAICKAYGPGAGAAFMASTYTLQTAVIDTSIGVTGYDDVVETWKRPRRAAWWKAGVARAQRLKMIDSNGAPRWGRPVWANDNLSGSGNLMGELYWAYAVGLLDASGKIGAISIFSEENPTSDLRQTPVVVAKTGSWVGYAEAAKSLASMLDSEEWQRRGLCRGEGLPAPGSLLGSIRRYWQFVGKVG